MPCTSGNPTVPAIGCPLASTARRPAISDESAASSPTDAYARAAWTSPKMKPGRVTSVGGVLLERALRQAPGLRVAADLKVAERQRRLEPPVVAVGGSQAFHEAHAELLAIGAPAQTDGAGRLVHQKSVAGELLHVLLDQAEPPRGLAAGDRG